MLPRTAGPAGSAARAWHAKLADSRSGVGSCCSLGNVLGSTPAAAAWITRRRGTSTRLQLGTVREWREPEAGAAANMEKVAERRT